MNYYGGIDPGMSGGIYPLRLRLYRTSRIPRQVCRIAADSFGYLRPFQSGLGQNLHETGWGKFPHSAFAGGLHKIFSFHNIFLNKHLFIIVKNFSFFFRKMLASLLEFAICFISHEETKTKEPKGSKRMINSEKPTASPDAVSGAKYHSQRTNRPLKPNSEYTIKKRNVKPNNEKKLKNINLLSKNDIARYLGISVQRFFQIEDALIAHGRITPIKVGKRVKYRKSSVDKVLSMCEEKGVPFYDPAWEGNN